MRDTTRDPKHIHDGQEYSIREVHIAALRAMYCLCHDAAVEEPNEAMKSSQAALNIANALDILDNLGR
jgi:hypothetical protein